MAVVWGMSLGDVFVVGAEDVLGLSQKISVGWEKSLELTLRLCWDACGDVFGYAFEHVFGLRIPGMIRFPCKYH